MTYIQNSLENTVIGENWIPAAKDIAKLVTMKFYQAHNEKFSTSSASPLDDDANRLGLSLSGNCNLPANILRYLRSSVGITSDCCLMPTSLLQLLSVCNKKRWILKFYLGS